MAALIASHIVRSMLSRKRKGDGSSAQRRKKGPANGYFMVKGNRTGMGRLLGIGASGRIRPELKSVDANVTFPSDNNFAAALATWTANAIGVGANFYNRSGRTCHLRSIQITIRCVLDATTVAGGLKYAVVLDRQPTASLPAYSDVFSDVSSAGTPSSDITSHMNLNNRDRFRILRHEVIQIPSGPGTPLTVLASSSTDFTRNYYIPLKNYRMVFKADNNTLTDIADGAIYVMVYNSNNNAAGAHLNVSVCARTRFIDT